MTELTAAAERLTRAIDKLEATARARVSEEPVSHGHDSGGDRQRLESELARARADHAQLATVTQGVSLRLDGAIERLKSALGD